MDTRQLCIPPATIFERDVANGAGLTAGALVVGAEIAGGGEAVTGCCTVLFSAFFSVFFSGAFSALFSAAGAFAPDAERAGPEPAGADGGAIAFTVAFG